MKKTLLALLLVFLFLSAISLVFAQAVVGTHLPSKLRVCFAGLPCQTLVASGKGYDATNEGESEVTWRYGILGFDEEKVHLIGGKLTPDENGKSENRICTGIKNSSGTGVDAGSAELKVGSTPSRTATCTMTWGDDRQTPTPSAAVDSDAPSASGKQSHSTSAESEIALAKVAFGNGDRHAGFHHLLLAAQQGNAPAEAAVGDMYRTGDGTAADPAQALFWTKKAAMGGNAAAAHNVGEMYAFGVGTAVDDAKAGYWFVLYSFLANSAALNDNDTQDQPKSVAEFNLGLIAAVASGIAFEQGESPLSVAVAYDAALLENLKKGLPRLKAEDQALISINEGRQKAHAACVKRHVDQSYAIAGDRTLNADSVRLNADTACAALNSDEITAQLNDYNKCVHANVTAKAIQTTCHLLN